MNKYAKEYLNKVVSTLNIKSATVKKASIGLMPPLSLGLGEYSPKEMAEAGKKTVGFFKDIFVKPFQNSWKNFNEAKYYQSIGDGQTAKIKNYQALGDLGLGVASAAVPIRGIATKTVMGGTLAAKPLFNRLFGAVTTGGIFGGPALSQYMANKYEKSGLKNLQSPQGQDLIQKTVLQSNPYVSTTSLDQIQAKPVSERSSLLPHLEVLEKMTSGYNPQ